MFETLRRMHVKSIEAYIQFLCHAKTINKKNVTQEISFLVR